MDPVRKIKIIVNKHAIIDEKKPFVLYLCEIKTQFSKHFVKKRFENFIDLQTKLCNMSNQLIMQKNKQKNAKNSFIIRNLNDVLPKLPNSFFSKLFGPAVPSVSDIQVSTILSN